MVSLQDSFRALAFIFRRSLRGRPATRYVPNYVNNWSPNKPTPVQFPYLIEAVDVLAWHKKSQRLGCYALRAVADTVVAQPALMADTFNAAAAHLVEKAAVWLKNRDEFYCDAAMHFYEQTLSFMPAAVQKTA